MDMKIIDLKKTILEDNDKDAELLRKETRAGLLSECDVISGLRENIDDSRTSSCDREPHFLRRHGGGH